MRTILIICLMGISLLAICYLQGRKLSIKAYLGWGLLSVLLPILVPFLVILSKPGKPSPH
jgi:hypothetical protein